MNLESEVADWVNKVLRCGGVPRYLMSLHLIVRSEFDISSMLAEAIVADVLSGDAFTLIELPSGDYEILAVSCSHPDCVIWRAHDQ